MPTKSTNTGGRGGKRAGAGRKKKSNIEKVQTGNPGGRTLSMLDIPHLEGVDMPTPNDYLSRDQKDGSVLQAKEIYEETWRWLDNLNVSQLVHPIICQSNAYSQFLKVQYPDAVVNPLGDWTGGTDVDTGATNRKLGSDMADSVTGGGLHGKDLSKADVSINIYAFLRAQQTGAPVQFSCAIGDEKVDGIWYEDIVAIAKEYIDTIGGFEKLAEWGLF